MFETSQARKGLLDRPVLTSAQATLDLLVLYLQCMEGAHLRDFALASSPPNEVDNQLTARWEAAACCGSRCAKGKGI